MTPFDIAALAVFIVAWAAYEPLLRRLSQRSGVLVKDMEVVRAAWMRRMARREIRLLDSQLLGHSLSSASFFASANLIVIAAAGGALFGGDQALEHAATLPAVEAVPGWLFDIKVALVAGALTRGLLDFIWSIRQMNYVLAGIGATPENADAQTADAWADALSVVLNPALTAFSKGVRAYYFALAAGAWLFGPFAFLGATAGAFALLAYRQARSPTSDGVCRIRNLVETEAAAPPPAPGEAGTGPGT